MTAKKFFGTDGIRGRVGDYPVTADFMLKLGWATGKAFVDDGAGAVLVGKDTRISGYMFESALEAGLTAAGVDTHLLGPMPTPGVAYLTRTLRAQAGIVISASHNPYYDNGVKFFSGAGVKLADALEQRIEYYLDQPMTTVDSSRLGKAKRIPDAAGRYIEFCKATIATTMQFHGLRIIVDCAHGATYHIAPHVFTEVGAEVVAIGAEPDGLNINEQMGATKPEKLAATVLAYRADLGIALDGDGDRVIMVDDQGEIVDGDQILFIIAKFRLQQGLSPDAVVGTLMSNLGLEHALTKLGLAFHRAKVGDRYVMELLEKTGGSLGGESSGHVICLDRTTTGDGIIAALQVLAAMYSSGESLHHLKQGMEKYPQVLLNITVRDKMSLDDSDLQHAVKTAEAELGDQGRVLLRASGTEPLIRVMVEGQDFSQVQHLAEQIASVVRSKIA
ncbi:MAG: phosphoglucosamine mutase [Methylococcales bacterium]|nr:phosphoglucosamine mutase [Methylococcales bacterium]